MKNYKLVYNSKGYLQEPIEESEFYVAQQEEGAVSFTVTFPAFLVGKVKAYIEFNGGGDIVECGDINLNSNSVTLTLSSSDYLIYNFLKVGFEVVTSTSQIRFQPVKIEVDGFVNVSGIGAKQAYTVSVKVGTVMPLENGEEPYVENIGTGKDVVLNFGLPKYVVDSVLSEESTNAVQNKIVTAVLNQKADITWIDIEVDASATDLKGSSGYPEELDTIADDGFYGIRVYQILHGGEDGNEEIHYSLYNEYLMVSKGESGVAQMYIDADKGIRIRNGKKKSDGTITWETWNQQFDYVDKTTEQDIYGTKNFMEDIRVAGVSGVNVDLPITGEDSLNLTANSGDVNINARNGVGNVNINGSVLAQDGIATASVTSLDGHLELMSDDMDITAGGQICMNGSTGISINCPGGIRIESKNSSINLKGDVQVDGMLVLLDTVGGAVSLSAGEIGSLPILFDENATNLVAVIQNLQAQVVALTQRVTALETVNQDLENIIALQQSYIGGDGA